MTKNYDGSLTALATAIVAAGGTQLFDTDTLSGGSYAFTNANAGSGRTVTSTAVTVNDGNGGGNYNVSYANNTTSTINQAGLTLSSGDVTKTYDGGFAAAGTTVITAGSLYTNANSGTLDSISAASYAFTDQNAGSANKTVTVYGATINDGNDGGNYHVTYASNTSSTINKAALTFAGTVGRKAYDGNNIATLAGFSLSGLVGQETLGIGPTTATFSDQHAAAGKTVSIAGIALVDGGDGGLASNYSVSSSATAMAAIDPKLLEVHATVANKVYDGNISATLQSYGLHGLVGDETVTAVSAGSTTFANKTAADGKTVTISGIGLLNGAMGGLASNYSVAAVATTTANIGRADLNVVGVVAIDKVYDGGLGVSVNTSAAILTGKIGGDDVGVGTMTGTFADKGVGSNKVVTGSGFLLSGSDGVNYNLIQPAGLKASISARSLAISATGVDRIYDAGTGATVNLADNRIAGDVLAISSNAAFLDKNVGVNKFIGVTGITLDGADAGNYTANSSSAAFATVSKAALTVSAAAQSKTYDAGSVAGATLGDNRLGSDALALSYGAASFADKNAGTGKAVSVSGISVTGADAGNYSFNTSAAGTANITAATLTVGATGVNKLYDGNTLAQVTLSDNRLAGDNVSLTRTAATFADALAGKGKTISVNGIKIAAGADIGNYLLANTAASTVADITVLSARWVLPVLLPQPPAPQLAAQPAPQALAPMAPQQQLALPVLMASGAFPVLELPAELGGVTEPGTGTDDRPTGESKIEGSMIPPELSMLD